MATPIRAVAFDLDGLLFNTEDLYQQVGTELLRRRNHRFGPELLDRMMGRPQAIALQIMIDFHQLPDTVEILVAETAEIFHSLLDTQLALMSGAAELLLALEQAGIPKAIATSSGPAFVDNVLARFELAPRFEFILTSENVQQPKPNPEIYQKAAAGFGVDPAEMLVLEDSHLGCKAAIASGAVAVAVPGGHSHTHDFTGAAHIAQSLADPWIYRRLRLPQAD